MEKRLIKIQALGKTFYLNNIDVESEIDYEQLATCLCQEKRYGEVDGLIILSPSREQDAFVQVYLANGIQCDFNVNALLCVGRLLTEQQQKNNVTMETAIGTFEVTKVTNKKQTSYSIKLYPISFDINKLRMNFDGRTEVFNEVIHEFSPTIRFTAISLIEPHLIGIVDAHYIEHCNHQLRLGHFLNDGKNEICKEGTNVSYVFKTKNDTLKVRTFEKNCEFCNNPIAMAASAVVAKRTGIVSDSVVTVCDENCTLQCTVEEDYVILTSDVIVEAQCTIEYNDKQVLWRDYNETNELAEYKKRMEHELLKKESFH